MAQLNLKNLIASIPQQNSPLPGESAAPLPHYERSANDSWNLLVYIERNLGRMRTYQAAREAHLHRLNSMVLVSVIETFERFIKEVAAVCIDHVGRLVVDDRLDIFSVKGNALASHFSTDTLGKSLCESDTWLDCEKINDRFRRFLADPFTKDSQFYVFPKPQQDKNEGWRYEAMSILWQLRHTLVHNVGVITQSDAMKLQLLVKAPVASPRLLWPRRADVWYVKLFLDETARRTNLRVAQRLSELLMTLRGADQTLFVPATKAQELANQFRMPVQVAGASASPTV